MVDAEKAPTDTGCNETPEHREQSIAERIPGAASQADVRGIIYSGYILTLL